MKKNISYLCRFLSLFCLFPLCVHGAEWLLDARSLGIEIPKDASPSEAFAAEELQTYFQKMGDVVIPIQQEEESESRTSKNIIEIGRQENNRELWKDLDNPDQFLIHSSENRLQIIGGQKPPVKIGTGNLSYQDRGVLYGVYQFLEEQGIRWFRPEPEGEEVPKRKILYVEEGQRAFAPAFPLRWGGALYATHRSPSVVTEEEREMAAMWALRNRYSVVPQIKEGMGGSIRIGGAGHSYDLWIPKRLFHNHPDYFPLIDGKRVPNGQRCLGNPELQEVFAQAIIAQAREHPEWYMVTIDPNDGAGWCECELCRAMDDPDVKSGRSDGLSMSPRVFAFNNIIAKKVSKEFPNLKLYSLAYSWYTEVPAHIEKLDDHLIVGLAPFAGAYSDYSKPLRDPESLPNARFLASIEGFHRLGATMYAREYLSGYAWSGPLPLLGVMRDRLGVYKDFGFIGLYNETHPDWGPQGIDLYFLPRLLWNPYLDLKKEMRDYCEKYYGPAAKPMLRYHTKLEERAKNGPYFGSGGSSVENLFTKDFLNALQTDVNEARALVKGHAPYDWRTESVLAGYETTKLYRQAADAIDALKFKEAEEEIEQLKDYFWEHAVRGDAFDKGDAIVGVKGNRRYPKFITSLENKLVKLDTIERKFADVRVLQSFDEGWRFHTDPENQGVKLSWNGPDVEVSDWALLKTNAPWQHQGFSDYTGAGWYRRTFPTPKSNGRIVLIFNAADGDATVWLNGKKVGRHDLIDPVDGHNRWDDPFYFDVTKLLKKDEDNTLVVRVRKEDGNGGLHRSVKLIHTTGELSEKK